MTINHVTQNGFHCFKIENIPDVEADIISCYIIVGHKKRPKLRSKSSSGVSETSLDTAYEEIARPRPQSISETRNQEKPTLPSRKPRLGQSSLTQTPVQPITSNAQAQVNSPCPIENQGQKSYSKDIKF